MANKMHRGKNQIMSEYLPGKVFDFDKAQESAIVINIRGNQNVDLNLELILRSIKNRVSAWDENLRQTLKNDSLEKKDNFILLEPTNVESEMFPLVLWCQNPACLRVFDFTNSHQTHLPKKCPECNGRLIQFRWIKIHRCGAVKPLTPPYCPNCKSDKYYSFDTRGSQKIKDFIWKCNKCGLTRGMYAGKCMECNWQTEINGVSKPKNMDIDIFRARKTFYSHNVVQLNIIKKGDSWIMQDKQWPEKVASIYLEETKINGGSLNDFFNQQSGKNSIQNTINIEDHLNELRKKGHSEEEIKKFISMFGELDELKQKAEIEKNSLVEKILEKTGVEREVWDRAGLEMLESVISKSKASQQILSSNNIILSSMGVKDSILVDDFPIMNATFGFSRADYRPNTSMVNTFLPSREHKGRIPIFVDTTQADAVFLRLDPKIVISWLKNNSFNPKINYGSDKELSEKSYFVKLFDLEYPAINFKKEKPEVRMVFGLLHTLSHMLIKKAALLCGLESTSLSEYILPKTLTIGLYSNHREGATIGALTSLFEQVFDNWMELVISANKCVYDPVCGDSGGNCHACTHLAETSCRFFNVNLSRSFLFGGQDAELGTIKSGFIQNEVL